MTRCELRQARYDHPDAVALTAEAQRYYRGIYGGEDTNPLDADEFSPPTGGFLVGYLDAQPVTMGGWRLHPDQSPEHHSAELGARPAELRRMFTRTAFRGRGYARDLLLALEEAARGAGADLMILETGAVQAEAMAFYARQGYRPIPAFGHWADSPGAVHLGRRLPPGAPTPG